MGSLIVVIPPHRRKKWPFAYRFLGILGSTIVILTALQLLWELLAGNL